jgi:hypothetical protein
MSFKKPTARSEAIHKTNKGYDRSFDPTVE